jgi:hypothetical protein
MRDIQIRVLKQTIEEADACANALSDKSAINLVDPAVLTYPATTTLVAASDKPKLFMPVQTCYVLESLGAAEGATDREIALSLKNMLAVVGWEARKAGHGEVYFLCSHEPTQQFAERHGFEKLNIPVFRMKL